jgi:uncharacterized membrane-anchored protein
MRKIVAGLVAGLLLISGPGFAKNSEDAPLDPEKLEAALTWKQGNVLLGHDLATLKVSSSFRYLPPEDAKTVLVKIWGNLPQQAEGTLGMIFPVELNPSDVGAWGVVISYIKDGYVKDDDAARINYDDLLQQIQKATKDANPERIKQGYDPVQMIGWAATPHYEKTSHKLYWATEWQFGESRSRTLNYSIRALGRSGVLVLNAVAAMSQLKEIEQRMPEVISMVEFNSGNRYTDFDSGTDKVAEYGIATLILGGAAAKAGLFKAILALLLAAKKFVVIGIMAVVAFVSRLFRRKKNSALLSPPTAHGSRDSF